ncbi:MAG: hypothetical protein P4L51_06905 [Puia sp.]|nr:hypothetical protein [Puia sp.]
MKNKKDFNKWRAEKLGYVYFSRLSDLIINEPNFKEPLFDYLIDIGENQKQTGRFFGVEVEPYSNNKHKLDDVLNKEYKNITFPALLVMFDNKIDHGYYTWIKRPVKDGQLIFDTTKNGIEELNDDSLNKIVNEVKDWYSLQYVAQVE